jgi:hypothetical protein
MKAAGLQTRVVNNLCCLSYDLQLLDGIVTAEMLEDNIEIVDKRFLIDGAFMCELLEVLLYFFIGALEVCLSHHLLHAF